MPIYFPPIFLFLVIFLNMSKRFQNLNKYRNAFPTVSKKEVLFIVCITVSTITKNRNGMQIYPKVPLLQMLQVSFK